MGFVCLCTVWHFSWKNYRHGSPIRLVNTKLEHVWSCNCFTLSFANVTQSCLHRSFWNSLWVFRSPRQMGRRTHLIFLLLVAVVSWAQAQTSFSATVKYSETSMGIGFMNANMYYDWNYNQNPVRDPHGTPFPYPFSRTTYRSRHKDILCYTSITAT